ncbi:hypothetical protein PCANB_002729 [Pneumocystis canis]|nr:hypothetical protein PCANB_002729 [Pneumocystis canis]
MINQQKAIYDTTSSEESNISKSIQLFEKSKCSYLKKKRSRNLDKNFEVTSNDFIEKLPNPDLLRALNNYISGFSIKYPLISLFESLDETALLALVEETITTLLGDGENMFIERIEDV